MGKTRIATAALVTRGSGHGVEVLCVRRNPILRFFGGYWAFPGGGVDLADHDGEPDADVAHQRCSFRELFEEVGLLDARLAPAGSLRAGLLERDSAPASRAFRGYLDGAVEVLEAAVPFARLTTPPFAPVLYRTRFVHVALESLDLGGLGASGWEPEVIEGELVEGSFWTPAELLASWTRGERLVAPPVVFMLEHLAELGLEGFLEEMPGLAAGLEAGKLHPIRNVPGIIMAPLATKTLPPATTTNCYLVGEERFFAVDPAPVDEAEQARLFDLIDERIAGEGGEAPRDFVGVLLTHHHPDHVGAVEATARRYDVPVLAHEETFARLALSVENQRPLNDGVKLPLGTAPDGTPGWVLTAHHTPGHAPGHLVFTESRYGAMIAGDLVSTVSTIVIDPPEGNMGQYLESLERAASLLGENAVLHPAHGPVASDGRTLLHRYVEHRQRREDALVKALEEGVSEESDLVARVYADVEAHLHPIAARSLRAGLEKLAEEGRAEELSSTRWTSGSAGQCPPAR
ncbi:Hydroxyacylglutathione hydrolase [Planctomycetes bacterium Poly30]|uniref:Hydroxyacylglutathione hydrolase n=1 Tax=Saltatorellus ferox TaxID=2528018 RepID=A0A518EPX9_9BACT|nr:Hydroxyacylglutathione hydrolase [Planctomycetes bacterium Poly30]